MDKQNTYLTRPIQLRAAAVRFILTVVGGLLTAFFLIGLVMTFTEQSMKGDWPYALVMLIPSALLLRAGIRAGQDAELARRYAACFAANTDAVVTLEELCRQSGRQEKKVTADLERLFRKGFFQGCALRSSPTSVVLTGTKKGEGRFVTVTCPHCGGTTRLRAGESGKCAYCDSAIDAD